jgi:hypothetical protein
MAGSTRQGKNRGEGAAGRLGRALVAAAPHQDREPRARNVERAALQARIEVAAAASMALLGRAAGGPLHHAWRALG